MSGYPPPRRKMPGDKHLAVIRHEAQLFDAAHTGLSRMGETPIWEIQKAALKDSQADDRQGIDCHEKGQRPFQPIFPLSPKSSLAGGLTGSQPRSTPRCNALLLSGKLHSAHRPDFHDLDR